MSVRARVLYVMCVCGYIRKKKRCFRIGKCYTYSMIRQRQGAQQEEVWCTEKRFLRL